MRVRKALSVFTGVSLVALATATMGAMAPSAGGGDPDVIEVRSYVLTLDKAEKAATALQSINQLVAANPSLNAALDAGTPRQARSPLLSRPRTSTRNIRRSPRSFTPTG